MIIAVLSDTHMDYPNEALEHVFLTSCRSADVLLHCGDIVGEAVWALLNIHPRFYAVRGNCDNGLLCGALPMLREVEVDGVRIGMGHGWGPRSQVGRTVASQFSGVDIVCYGHTHIRDWSQGPDGVWLLNPGSLFLPRAGEGGLAHLIVEPGRAPRVEWITLS